jgi:aspartyl-tRNA(Asn)/glutamyl-tRNA(Gln) amidotransferase subunit A
VETLKRLGAVVVDVEFKMLKYVIPVYYLIACSEASSNLARFDGVRYGVRVPAASEDESVVESRTAGFGEEVRRRIMLGTYSLSAGYYDKYYNKALKVRRLIKDDFYRVLDECDAYLCPSAPGVAYKLGENVDDVMSLYLADVFTVTANLTGTPAASFPAGFSSTGMPIGMQLCCKGLGESTLFSAVHAFQRETDFHLARPTFFGGTN